MFKIRLHIVGMKMYIFIGDLTDTSAKKEETLGAKH